MAWVAFDRAVHARGDASALDGPVDRWRALRDEIHAEVCAHGFDAERGTFTQSYGSQELDASLLLIPLVGFLPATDPRVRGTVEAIERDARRGRLRPPLPHGRTAASTACRPARASSCRARSGSPTASSCSAGTTTRRRSSSASRARNDVGLLSEEYDPRAKRMLGNFPQAFTHLALVNSAFNVAAHLPSPMHRRHADPGA